MPVKSQDAYRTISEVSEILDLPQHVLRFWETRFRQIKPLKRAGGRRYYRPDDIAIIRGIKHYLYVEGYTIKGVQKLLKESGIAVILEEGKGKAKSPTTSISGQSSSTSTGAGKGLGAPKSQGPKRVLLAALKELEEIRVQLNG